MHSSLFANLTESPPVSDFFFSVHHFKPETRSEVTISNGQVRVVMNFLDRLSSFAGLSKFFQHFFGYPRVPCKNTESKDCRRAERINSEKKSGVVYGQIEFGGDLKCCTWKSGWESFMSNLKHFCILLTMSKESCRRRCFWCIGGGGMSVSFIRCIGGGRWKEILVIVCK